MHAERQTLPDFLKSMHDTFGKNISYVTDEFLELIEIIDTNNRNISEIGELIKSNYCATGKHCENCVRLVDEVFSDVAQAMYLIVYGLIVPGRMVTRRALEIGLAVPYLWDQPHEYWLWAEHDGDLSFSTIVNHLSSKGYQAIIERIHSGSCSTFDSAEAQKLYRTLSNTVHGKIDLLPQLSPERFDIRTNSAKDHLETLRRVTELLIQALDARFPKVS